MRLNVGCGEFYADGWTNLDAATDPRVRVDIHGTLLDLPEQVRGVEAVYLGHVLEHIPFFAAPHALRRLWRRCRPGAAVAIVGPDIVRAWDMAIAGELDQDVAVRAALGDSRWPGDTHRWACHEQRLLDLARASGLAWARAVPIDSPVLDDFPVVSRIGWQCAVVGSAPKGAVP